MKLSRLQKIYLFGFFLVFVLLSIILISCQNDQRTIDFLNNNCNNTFESFENYQIQLRGSNGDSLLYFINELDCFETAFIVYCGENKEIINIVDFEKGKNLGTDEKLKLELMFKEFLKLNIHTISFDKDGSIFINVGGSEDSNIYKKRIDEVPSIFQKTSCPSWCKVG